MQKYNTFNIEKILRDYEKTRLENKYKLQELKKNLYKECPDLEKIEENYAMLSLKEARIRISKDLSSLEELEKEKKELLEARNEILIRKNLPLDFLTEIYSCKLCYDTGYVNNQKCSCFTEKIIDSLYSQSKIKENLQRENFFTFSLDYYSKEKLDGYDYSPYENISNIINKSKKYIEDFSKNKGNILIYGETGLGKTFLTNCIAKELLDQGHTVLYLSSNELFENILSNYLMNKTKDVTLKDLYDYIYNCEFLIIDVLGTELSNNFVLSQLFEIINKRHINNRSTLISTNHTMTQLRDKYTERIMSRIVADYTVFCIYGDNIRYQKRKKAINANI